MPFVEIAGSPLQSTGSTARIHYRRNGSGFPLVFLHGGWGYEVYPFDRQIEAFGDQFEVLIPDRSGYGQSSRIEHLPVDFHMRAAHETILFLEALGIERAVLWGHSDGAVIAANMGIEHPEKFAGIMLEAFHYDREKPRSRDFFGGFGVDPDALKERIREVLARDHGTDYWREILKMGSHAWLEIARTAHLPDFDLCRGRLAQLRVPSLFVHGSDDPRTEPGELERVAQLLPRVPITYISGGGHAPHAERDVWREVNRVAQPFLARVLEGEAS
ncbi:MAG: alpha/beta hydrolase [Acidobacteriota bacterium]